MQQFVSRLCFKAHAISSCWLIRYIFQKYLETETLQSKLTSPPLVLKPSQSRAALCCTYKHQLSSTSGSFVDDTPQDPAFQSRRRGRDQFQLPGREMDPLISAIVTLCRSRSTEAILFREEPAISNECVADMLSSPAVALSTNINRAVIPEG